MATDWTRPTPKTDHAVRAIALMDEMALFGKRIGAVNILAIKGEIFQAQVFENRNGCRLVVFTSYKRKGPDGLAHTRRVLVDRYGKTWTEIAGKALRGIAKYEGAVAEVESLLSAMKAGC